MLTEIITRQWNMTEDHANHSQAGNIFMLGVGGPVVVALSAYFGRLPVLFYFVLMALATAIWCTAAQSFESFMVCPYKKASDKF